MTHEPFDTLAAVAALGALDGDDRVQFEAHLAQGCERCEATLRESDEALVALARSAPPAIPPAGVKAALMARVAGAPTRAAAPGRWRAGTVAWIAGAAAAAIAGAVFSGTLVARHYDARVRALAVELTAARQRLDAERRVADLLTDPATRIVTLQGRGAASQASGRLVWHATAGGDLYVANLPPAPAGQAYELWAIADGPPRPAGVFNVDADGRATHRVPAAEGDAPVKVFAVTLEPEQGVPAPTGPIVLASTN